jgi:hypothetical protein
MRTEVVTGKRQQDMVEVLSGLEVEQLVITAGQMKIMEGSKVQPVNLGGDTAQPAADKAEAE